MKATVTWLDGVKFQGTSDSGHSVIMDGSPDHGGLNQGMRPMELLLLGVGGCASFDVVYILRKARQVVTHCEAKIEADRVDAVPAVFSKIHLHFIVSGENLKLEQVKKAVELSAEKYCSGSIMMKAAGVDVTHSYEVIAL